MSLMSLMSFVSWEFTSLMGWSEQQRQSGETILNLCPCTMHHAPCTIRHAPRTTPHSPQVVHSHQSERVLPKRRLASLVGWPTLSLSSVGSCTVTRTFRMR